MNLHWKKHYFGLGNLKGLILHVDKSMSMRFFQKAFDQGCQYESFQGYNYYVFPKDYEEEQQQQ